MLDDIEATPLTLLVVPRFHYRADVSRDRYFVQAMEARLARGDELALHGLFHIDDAPLPRTLRDWFERRMLTRAEGEFAALDGKAAAWRIARGVALFEALGWPLAGFVPPAWLLSNGARIALERCDHRFEYITVRSGMFHLPGWRFERTGNLWYSPTSVARRALTACAIRRELFHARARELLRVSLHPQDARVPGVIAHWRRIIVRLLARRTPVTKRAWTQRFKAAPPLAAPPRAIAHEDAIA